MTPLELLLEMPISLEMSSRGFGLVDVGSESPRVVEIELDPDEEDSDEPPGFLIEDIQPPRGLRLRMKLGLGGAMLLHRPGFSGVARHI